MRTLVSFALGAALLFGAATLVSQSGSASAQTKPATTPSTQTNKNKMNNTKTRHHRHRRHRRHKRQHKLSY